MTQTLTLLPQPQKLTLQDDTISLDEGKLIALDVNSPAEMHFTAQQARQAIFLYTGKLWSIVGGTTVPDDKIGLLITFDKTIEHDQGYRLTITGEQISIRAKDAAGAFYGVMTLTQVLQRYGTLPDLLSSTEQSGLTPMQVMKQRTVALPVLEVEDWPDFPRRGVMLDISRDKVPTMRTLTALVDKLASWKINEFQLYTEHTFAYRNHPDVWADASPITARQILVLDAYCKERFIDLVPNQNSFGHMHRWFEYEQYMPMAETEAGHETPWGDKRELPFSLTPANPDSLTFVEGLFDELLPNFTSQYFNVGADETWDLGQGRSKALCDEKGKGRVYLEFLLAIYERTKARGRTMQYWGDIIGNHPELVAELPKDAVALEWGYEADHDFPNTTERFAKAGVPFYVCPGTSSWCSIAGRTDNAIGNIRSAVENGLKHGAMGVLNTDWGDGGHWQPLPVSYLGFVYGAAVSWRFEGNKDIDLAAVLDAFVFEDKGGVMGQLAVDLGNIYQKPGVHLHNSSVLFWAISLPLDALEKTAEDESLARRITQGMISAGDAVEKMHQTVAAVDAIMATLPQAAMGCRDASLVVQEFMLAAELLKHGAKRILVVAGDKSVTVADIGIEFAELQEQYKAVWMARNRPGGLEDSLKRMRGERVLYE
jgi:hexosaminidase